MIFRRYAPLLRHSSGKSKNQKENLPSKVQNPRRTSEGYFFVDKKTSKNQDCSFGSCCAGAVFVLIASTSSVRISFYFSIFPPGEIKKNHSQKSGSVGSLPIYSQEFSPVLAEFPEAKLFSSNWQTYYIIGV